MYSTVVDLFRFQQALSNGELLQTESVKKMYHSHVIVGDSGILNYFKGYEETGYGYGVFVKQWPLIDNTTTLMVMAPGALPFGFYNNFVYFPEKKIYIVTVENSNQYFFPNDIINILIQNNSGTEQNKIR